MSISLLRLPTDIPWERICVSEDMIAKRICGNTFPPKWQSSIAVFKYKPSEEYQEFPNHDVIYLKVTVTITGYQPRDAEIEGSIDWEKLSVEMINEVEDLLNEYHPCTGAIVQVAVSPSDFNVNDLENYPYFVDFEPKKRELFEMATDTYERMSRSLSTLNVGKSASTTQSLEVLDIDMGSSWSVGGNVQLGEGYGGGLNIGSSNQGQWGTKEVGSNQSGVSRTTDQGTERRETSSFTTQITQMYHQLDSYHLGTNRAVFFVQPRPHTVEEPSGFVRGPRPVEGIQEFFLLVAKPKNQKDICVSVRLDTAHLTELPIMEYLYKKDSLSLSVNVPPPSKDDSKAIYDGEEYMKVYAPIINEYLGNHIYSCYKKRIEKKERYVSPWSDYKIDITNNGGYTVISNASYGGHTILVQPDGESLEAKVWAESRKCFDNGGFPCLNCPPETNIRSAYSNIQIVVNLRSREEINQIGTEQFLLVTTRGVCCCSTENNQLNPIIPEIIPGIIATIPLESVIARRGGMYGLSAEFGNKISKIIKSREEKINVGDKTNITSSTQELMSVREANALTSAIRAELIASVSPGLSEAKLSTPYIFHDYFLTKLDRRLRILNTIPWQTQKSREILNFLKGKEVIEEIFNKPFDQITNKDISRIPVRKLASIANIDVIDAAKLRLAALGINIITSPETKNDSKYER